MSDSGEETPTVVGESEHEFFGLKTRVLVLSNGMRIVPREDFEKWCQQLGLKLAPEEDD